MNRRDFIKSAIIGAAGVSVPLNALAGDIEYRIRELHKYWHRVLVWDRKLTEMERENVGLHLVKEAVAMCPNAEGVVCIIDPVSYDGYTVAVVKYPHSKHSDSSE